MLEIARWKGSLGVDVLIRYRGKPVIAFELKTGKGMTQDDIAKRKKWIGATVIQVTFKPTKGKVARVAGENMKVLKNSLAALGFKSISRSIFACRAGDLVHAVFLTKDRYGGDVFSVLVCIPSFFEQDAPLTLDNLQSPLAGDVSPRGVVSSWAWEKGALDVALVVDVIKGFFKEFATSADVRRALDGLYVSPYFEELMPLDSPAPAGVTALPSACYEIDGGARSLSEAAELARAHLAVALAPLGFTMPSISDVVAVRRRGEMFDAVRVVLDDLGAFVTLTCFPWPAAIWRADEQWTDRFYPMVSYTVMQDGKPYLLSRQAFLDTDPALLRSLLEDGIRRSSEVNNHLQFADGLGSSFAAMAEKLRRIPL